MIKNNKYPGIVMIVVLLLTTIFIIAKIRDMGTDTASPDVTLSVESCPDRSSHEEVDATTGATLLWNEQKSYQNIKVSPKEGFVIIYPFGNSVFPADFSPASFIWKSDKQQSASWRISFRTQDFEYEKITKETRFKPDGELWMKLKKESKNENISFTVRNKNIEKKYYFVFQRIQ